MISNNIHKKGCQHEGEEIKGDAVFHVIGKMMRGWVYGDKLHINVGGKKSNLATLGFLPSCVQIPSY